MSEPLDPLAVRVFHELLKRRLPVRFEIDRSFIFNEGRTALRLGVGDDDVLYSHSVIYFKDGECIWSMYKGGGWYGWKKKTFDELISMIFQRYGDIKG